MTDLNVQKKIKKVLDIFLYRWYIKQAVSESEKKQKADEQKTMDLDNRTV